jgi:signal transduction histidine kinase
MNTAATLSVIAALLGVAVAALSLRVSRLQGWGEARWFAAVSALAAAYAVASLVGTFATTTTVVVWASRAQVAIILLQGFAWMRYAEAFGRAPTRPAARWLEGVLVVAAGLMLFPGLGFLDDVRVHVFTGWGVVYTDAIFQPAGVALLLGSTLPAAAVVLLRFLDAHRRKVQSAWVQAAACAVFVALCVNDALVGTGRFDWPFLLDLGFLLVVGLVVWGTVLRFVSTARDLEALRARLEVLVEQRTQALADAQEALVRAERLAALGQLGNGVAHQVSNPASVVTANLRFLAGKFAQGEEREVADDALAAMQRINDLVRRLADAGRIAAGPRASVPVDLADVVVRTLAEARGRLPSRLALEAELAPGLHVRARPEVLEQVLQSLIANAAEAVPQGRAGRIDVRAERRAGGIRLTVTDDGVGMPPEVLERAFEPFFTTKAASLGSGLGLPVSRGIVEVHGGALWLESAPEHGTTAVLVLPESAQGGG